ncbi:unnamed protein product [Adineta steineri]|uniref:G-protein coupled receptors family 1 profile domain-containing protein n=1 Tax=Adineta steineri TaxID=433720 RepID=A0A813RKC6_9BILA|nr:unnamed protein product [Adineta steineri]CAF4010518.1 unnamed protein product [Adineta steineri]
MTNATEYIIFEKYKTFTQQFTKYAGIPLYIGCFYGTVMNMIIFGQRTYRHRSGALYLLIASLCDFIYLNIGPISNILQYGFQHNWTINSIKFCKIKSYFVFVITAISATLTTLANINQYLLSSKKNKRWKYTSYIITIRCTCFTIICWFIISIPIIFCYTRYYHSSGNEELLCSNPLHGLFCFWIQILYTCLFNGFLHPFLMLFFGICTYKNIHNIQERSILKSNRIRQVNYQMALMLVLQSIKSSFASVPYAIFNTYMLITINRNKTLLHQAKENIFSQIVYFLFWSNYTSFFVYMYSSTIFKDQWKKLMKKIFCCLYGKRQRQLHYQTQLKQMTVVQSMVKPN